MAFADIIGQKTVKEVLQAAIHHDRLAHAYLFFGPEGVGKEFTALQLAKALNCQTQSGDACEQCQSCRKINKFNHPDVKLIFPTPAPSYFKPEDMTAFLQQKATDPTLDYTSDRPQSIAIDTVRELQKEAQYRPFQARKKVYIMLDVDKMTTPAANSFLKTLEEPPPYAQFVLTTTNINGLLDTIISRCQTLQFTPLSIDEVTTALVNLHSFDPTEARLAARFAHGRLGVALNARDNQLLETRNQALKILEAAFAGHAIDFLNYIERASKANDRGLITQLLDVLQFWYRDMLIFKETGNRDHLTNIDLIESIEQTAEQLSIKALMESVDIIEEIKYDINRNVHVQLAITVLLLRLRKARRLK